MDRKTFKALEYVLDLVREAYPHDTPKEVTQLEYWMDEVEKDFTDLATLGTKNRPPLKHA